MRSWMRKRGACVATKEAHGVMGCARAMFSYRVDAEAMKAESGREHDELEAARVKIKNGTFRVSELAGKGEVKGQSAEMAQACYCC